MENDGVRPHTEWGQWDATTWPDTVLWRGEYSERYQAEVQRTAMGIGVLALFDHERRNCLVTLWPVPLPVEAAVADADRWNRTVRDHLYAPPPRYFAVRNVYRRGWRRK
ncbi:MAG: hypothetical protein Q7R85_00485 [bacterium]|nr:hypothetical protein [bacterium]